MATKNGIKNGKTTEVAESVNYEADAGSGMEGADRESFAIPFLQVLQKGSPQCDPDSGQYIKGALPGMLHNTVTNELFDGKAGITIIPCAYQRRWIHWGNRKAGGGFKGELTTDQVQQMRINKQVKDVENRTYVVDEKGEVDPEESDIVADTRNHFVMVVGSMGYATPAVLALGSTQIKKSKQLMTALAAIKWPRSDGSMFTPPTFGVQVKLTTVPESNDRGAWSGVKFEVIGKVSDSTMYQSAKAFHDQVQSGAVSMQTPPQQHNGGDTEKEF